MLRKILSIAGKPGLYRLLSQGKSVLIIEQLGTGKRMPAHAKERVISLGDISIYTTEGDVPLADVLEKVKAKAEGQPVDIKGFPSDQAIRDYFAEILPTFDNARVYTTDIKKLLSWYNILLSAGITEYKDPEPRKIIAEVKEVAKPEEDKAAE